MSASSRPDRSLLWPSLVGIVVCEGVGLLAAAATQSSVTTWYPTLAKPVFTPPDWLFAPVWTLLYAMMGVAAALVWRAEGRAARREALLWFGLQLLLNGGWSFAFFGARSPTAGLAVIVALWGALAVTTRRFFALRRAAGWLLVPYLLWVSYALALNLGIWLLN
jgi:tryptophan-rich sensory protein